jgi:hypothetical protein
VTMQVNTNDERIRDEESYPARLRGESCSCMKRRPVSRGDADSASLLLVLASALLISLALAPEVPACCSSYIAGSVS